MSTKGGASGWQGHLDSLTSTGYFEGWALDPAHPLKPMPVAIVKGSEIVASGLAHRFRWDLMDASCGTGWCAFRLLARCSVEELSSASLRLVEFETGKELHASRSIAIVPDNTPAADTVERICAYDPTVIEGVWQLRACEKLFMAFIRKHGVDQFVRMAYVYVLGRPADDGGLAQYGRSIRQATLSPVGVLEALADSDEYRSQPRQLIAPNALGFPLAA